MVHQQHPVTFHSSSSNNVNQPPHSYLQPKPIQNGRIPATKHDNRKLFVGGLPNEGKGSQIIIICRCSLSIFLRRCYTYALLFSISLSTLCLNTNTQLPITHSFSFFNSMERW
jgi:hypothetical protein